MSKITVKELQAITRAEIGRRVSDDGSLWGRVRENRKTPSGVSVTFWYRFKWNGKTQDIGCGTWPSESLSEIRKCRDIARTNCASGINPAELRKINLLEEREAIAEKLASSEKAKTEKLTFRDMFVEWVTFGVRRKDNNHEIHRSFNADVLPKIGTKPVNKVVAQDLREILISQVNRGVNRMAVMTANNLSQMFRWAEKEPVWRKLMVDGNPASLIEIKKIVALGYDMNNERERVLSVLEIRELHDKFSGIEELNISDSNGSVSRRPLLEKTEIALWIMLATMCRVGELSKARWEHVDLQIGEWFLPAVTTKSNNGKQTDFKIYLSDFVREQFGRLHKLTGHSQWCFPASFKDSHICEKSISKQVGDRQVIFKKDKDGDPRKPMMNRSKDCNALVLSDGKNGAWTPHDLRRTGSTLMQADGISLDVIDRCQHHVIAGSKIRRHYMHHDYAKEKKEAWQRLSNKLRSIFSAMGD